MDYKGFVIEDCGNGSFDIFKDGEMMDGDFKTISNAKEHIDFNTRARRGAATRHSAHKSATRRE